MAVLKKCGEETKWLKTVEAKAFDQQMTSWLEQTPPPLPPTAHVA